MNKRKDAIKDVIIKLEKSPYMSTEWFESLLAKYHISCHIEKYMCYNAVFSVYEWQLRILFWKSSLEFFLFKTFHSLLKKIIFRDIFKQTLSCGNSYCHSFILYCLKADREELIQYTVNIFLREWEKIVTISEWLTQI